MTDPRTDTERGWQNLIVLRDWNTDRDGFMTREFRDIETGIVYTETIAPFPLRHPPIEKRHLDFADSRLRTNHA